MEAAFSWRSCLKLILPTEATLYFHSTATEVNTFQKCVVKTIYIVLTTTFGTSSFTFAICSNVAKLIKQHISCGMYFLTVNRI